MCLQVPIYLEDGSLPSKELDEQIEEDYNKLLDACSTFRDNLGEVADNISLGVPLQQFWEDTCAARAAAKHGPYTSNDGDLLQRIDDMISVVCFSNVTTLLLNKTGHGCYSLLWKFD